MKDVSEMSTEELKKEIEKVRTGRAPRIYRCNFKKQEYNRKYSKLHSKELNAYRKRYYEAHKEECIAYQKSYYKTHGKEVRAKAEEKTRLHKRTNDVTPKDRCINGCKEPWYILQRHHLTKTKIVIFCPNCHAKYHYKKRSAVSCKGSKS